MKVLVTGAKGFIGKNLTASLEAIRDGKDRAHIIDGLFKGGSYQPEHLNIVSYHTGSAIEELEEACIDCDFVFNLAGVNRTKSRDGFMGGNFGFAQKVLNMLKKYNNTCPVMQSSSIQASLTGRYGESDYGKSKLAGEELLLNYGEETGARVLIYRFPNVFGKWCRPNYNSAAATFCHNIANDLPIQVNDRNIRLELLYIDDLVEEMLLALNGREHRCEFDGLSVVPKKDGHYCYVPVVHKVKLGKIVDLLEQFRQCDTTLSVPVIPAGSFDKKLYSTYLSYLPEGKIRLAAKMNVDARGSFTELVHTPDSGQVSINIANPGINRGHHWHHSKWEIFIVVAGEGLIRQRKIGSEHVIETRVSGKRIEQVRILPGYTHCIMNLSDTESLITVMWANEPFDPGRPDTFSENV